MYIVQGYSTIMIINNFQILLLSIHSFKTTHSSSSACGIIPRSSSSISPRLNRIGESAINEEVHSLQPIGVLRNGQGKQSVLECEEIRAGLGVLWPIDVDTVGIEGIDELDEVVCHITATIHVEDVSAVSLIIISSRLSIRLETLKEELGLTEPKIGKAFSLLFE
jgi:hypothetical protein